MKPDDCKQVFELLSQYLDRELPPGECADIEKHIADCPPCIDFLDSLKKTMRLCRGYEASEQPGPLEPETRDRLEAAFRAMVARKGGAGS